MNMMQMLHGCYNIRNWHTSSKLKYIWMYITVHKATNLKFKKLEEPVLNRWWLVGGCATSFKESYQVWKKLLNAICKSAPANSACNKIASYTLNLMITPVIMNDLEMRIAFHTAFIFPHFKFMQIGDPKTGGTPIFLGRHCTLGYHIIQKDINAIKDDGWKQHDDFRDFVQSLNLLNPCKQEQQQQKLTFFVQYLKKSINKHFEQWSKRNSFLGLFADQPSAKPFARQVMGVRTTIIRGNYYCTFHKK